MNEATEANFEQKQVVSLDVTIRFMGPGVTPVLSTPALIMWLELAAREAARPLLGPDEDTVGTAVDVKHLAATPLGMAVTVKARVVGVEGRLFRFEVEAFDQAEKIAEGTHQRARVNVPRFADRVLKKLQTHLPGG